MKKGTIIRHATLGDLLVAIVIVGAPLLAFAQAPTGAPTTIQALYGAICTVANWFFAFMLVGALIAFIYAGFLFFSSGGGQRVEQAKKTLMYAFIGTGIAILSRTFIVIIGSLLGVDSGDLIAVSCG